MPGSRETKVTIIIVPRERFSYALTSLDSVLSNTSMPYHLVYVDTDSPIKLRRALKRKSHAHGFKLIRTAHFLTPNEARNLGMRYADTPFVAIMDNDVHCAPGWLESLLRCAEETGAAVVSPVITSGPMSEAGPDFETVHAIGGEVGFYERDGIRGHYERSGYSMIKLDRIQHLLSRSPLEIAEFHCMLIRRDMWDFIGGFDEGLKNTREHTDFCLRVRAAGKSIYLEPTARVSYVTAPPLAWSDLGLYLFRWSRRWNEVSLDHMNSKWNLNEDHASLKINWLAPQRRVALKPLRATMVRLLGNRLADGLVDHLERAWIWNAMRKRRNAGLDLDINDRGTLKKASAHAQNS
jgi:GT2 family glycosyltransferase